MERLGLAILATLLALAIAVWLYGVYCYVQMVRNRAPGTSPFQLGWLPQQLTQRGREFRRRALGAYAAFGLLALLLLLLGILLGMRWRRRAG
jgi:hypothetical protein